MSSPLGDAVRNLQLQGQLNFSGYARAEGHVQAAINAITAVQRLEGPDLSSATGDEYGEVLWMQHEHSLALQLAEGMKMGLDLTEKGGPGRSGILTSRIVSHLTYLADNRQYGHTEPSYYQSKTSTTCSAKLIRR
jgi:hypothetical protein